MIPTFTLGGLTDPGLGGGGAPAFTPDASFFAGAAGFAYDLATASQSYQDLARTTLVAANGDPIASPTDLSGNGKHGELSTAGARPLFQSGANFDGADDYLATPAIDFTGTDKITVIASVRRTSPGGFVQPIVELSADALGAAGAFAVFAGENETGDYSAYLHGTTTGYTRANGFTIPTTNLLLVEFDIGGASLANEISLEVDGAVPSPSSSGGGAGTGNFGSHRAYIGRRGGTGAQLTADLYRIIVIGRLLTAPEKAAARSWVGDGAGLFF